MLLPAPLAALIVSLTAWLGGAIDTAPDARQSGQEMTVRQMVVRDELILHIPIAERRLPAFEWVEHKGPKCVPAAMIAGAAMATPSTIDFVLRNRRRVRARLDSDCAGLDFYGGFYVEPHDGAVCAKREEIRSRAGSSCRIERFRGLERRFKR